ncbi:MAG: hypothetical protein ACJ8AI_22090 [Rhodopila sp.]
MIIMIRNPEEILWALAHVAAMNVASVMSFQSKSITATLFLPVLQSSGSSRPLWADRSPDAERAAFAANLSPAAPFPAAENRLLSSEIPENRSNVIETEASCRTGDRRHRRQ